MYLKKEEEEGALLGFESGLQVSHNEPGPSSLLSLDATPPNTGRKDAYTKDKRMPPELVNIDFPVPSGGEEPPPEFTPYEAECFITSSGDIISHDKHLNEDGEALYRFLLAQSQQNPPGFFLKCHGSHTERRTRWVQSKDNNGHWQTHAESYTETIVDFDFSINVHQHLVSGPIHWSVADEEPAYRGQMHREVDDMHAQDDSALERGLELRPQRREATGKEVKSARAWRRERDARGLPPWVGPGVSLGQWNIAGPELDPSQTAVLKSSKSLRQWADEYCASKKHLKEFTYDRYVYGWNLAALEQAVCAAIKSMHYGGSLEVKFVRTCKYIHIRPDNHLSRTLSNKWIKFFLCILLIYPFIWLYKRFSGGGKWEVCGGAYALKRWAPVIADHTAQNSDALPPYDVSDSNAAVAPATTGVMRLVGVREGEWFQRWEGTIKRAVSRRLQTDVPLAQPDDAPTHGVATLLDGYQLVA